MQRNPYQRIAKVRERAKEASERAFAEAQQSLAEAEARRVSAEAATLESAPDLPSAELWIVADLDHTRRLVELARAEQAVDAAGSAAERARVALVDAKVRADAARELDTRHVHRERAKAAKREQTALDELALLRARQP